MDLQSFIQSGLLESYVLGQCTARERSLVEQMLSQHAEARAEMSAIEQALEGYANAHAIAPPAGLKDQVMNAIEREMNPHPIAHAPGSNIALRAFQLAALALLIAAIFFFFQKNQANEEKTALQQKVAQLEVQISNCTQRSEAVRQIIAVLRDPETKAVRMSDSPDPATAKVNGYAFNNQLYCKVVVDINTLPAPGPGKYLQFWALMNGGASVKSMGMVDLQISGGLQAFECIPGATGYAVSEEDKPEGNATPTVVLMGGS